jgi:drug/metabolite transporter (DMT)-like permease
MLAVLLALASAISYGGSDYVAGLAARAASVIRLTIAQQVTGVVLAVLIVPWIGGGALTTAAAAWGATAGVIGVAGAMVLYLGFRHAAFSVASTLSAVGSAGLSVLAGLLLGERPSALALTGIALALPAIAAVSISPASSPAATPASSPAATPPDGPAEASAGAAPGGHLKGVLYGLLAGACFALYFISLNRAGSGSGLWPILISQLAGLLTAAIVGAVTGQLRLPPRPALNQSVLTGTAAIVGTTLFFLASHRGLLAVTAVITSLYPAVTILLARILLGERLTWVRMLGLCLAAASVALIAVLYGITIHRFPP